MTNQNQEKKYFETLKKKECSVCNVKFQNFNTTLAHIMCLKHLNNLESIFGWDMSFNIKRKSINQVVEQCIKICTEQKRRIIRNKGPRMYYCDICKAKFINHKIHNNSNIHLKRLDAQNGKNFDYECEHCLYYTNKKECFKHHLKTKKHIQNCSTIVT